MNIIWSESALDVFSATADYVQENFGDIACAKFIQKVKHTADILSCNPGIGIIEPRLSKASIKYRSINADGINRIVYFVEEDCIHIVDFWNMRRNPKTLANRVLKNT